MARLSASNRCILRANAYKSLKAGGEELLSKTIARCKYRARAMSRMRIGDVKSSHNRNVKITI